MLTGIFARNCLILLLIIIGIHINKLPIQNKYTNFSFYMGVMSGWIILIEMINFLIEYIIFGDELQSGVCRGLWFVGCLQGSELAGRRTVGWFIFNKLPVRQ